MKEKRRMIKIWSVGGWEPEILFSVALLKIILMLIKNIEKVVPRYKITQCGAHKINMTYFVYVLQLYLSMTRPKRKSKNKSHPHVCVMCHEAEKDGSFKRRKDLEKHVKDAHPSSPRPPPKCPCCGRLFNRQADVQRHVKEVHEKQYHQCKICKKRLSQLGHLTRHMRPKHK